jgi:hypothetical protein
LRWKVDDASESRSQIPCRGWSIRAVAGFTFAGNGNEQTPHKNSTSTFSTENRAQKVLRWYCFNINYGSLHYVQLGRNHVMKLGGGAPGALLVQLYGIVTVSVFTVLARQCLLGHVSALRAACDGSPVPNSTPTRKVRSFPSSGESLRTPRHQPQCFKIDNMQAHLNGRTSRAVAKACLSMGIALASVVGSHIQSFSNLPGQDSKPSFARRRPCQTAS